MKYKSIKQLVIEEAKKLNGEFPEKKYLKQLVKENFPNSKWQKTHYSWYKSKIKNEDNSDTNPKELKLSLEKDLQSYLSSNLNKIEEGLELIENGIEYKTKAGYIDLLAKDKNDNYVVLELKAGKGKDAAIGQTLGYIGALTNELKTDKIRGIIVASDFDERLKYAAISLNNLTLVKYSIIFDFSKIK